MFLKKLKLLRNEQYRKKIKRITEFHYEAVLDGEKVNLGTLNLQEQREFCEEGLFVKESLLDGESNTIHSNGYHYENGVVVEESWFNEKNQLTEKLVFTYDEQGNEIETKIFNENGELINVWNKKYDERGNRIESCVSNADKELISETRYFYDDENNLIEVHDLDDESQLVEKNVYHYNEENLKVQSQNYDEETLSETEKFKYDEHQNVTEIESDEDGEVQKFSFEYVYNEDGVWIKKICFADGLATEVIVRELECYN